MVPGAREGSQAATAEQQEEAVTILGCSETEPCLTATLIHRRVNLTPGCSVGSGVKVEVALGMVAL